MLRIPIESYREFIRRRMKRPIFLMNSSKFMAFGLLAKRQSYTAVQLSTLSDLQISTSGGYLAERQKQPYCNSSRFACSNAMLPCAPSKHG